MKYEYDSHQIIIDILVVYCRCWNCVHFSIIIIIKSHWIELNDHVNTTQHDCHLHEMLCSKPLFIYIYNGNSYVCNNVPTCQSHKVFDPSWTTRIVHISWIFIKHSLQSCTSDSGKVREWIEQKKIPKKS